MMADMMFDMMAGALHLSASSLFVTPLSENQAGQEKVWSG